MDTTTRTNIDGQAASPPATSTDQRLHAMASLFTGGLSPTAVQQAWWDWAQHLLLSPDKQAELAGKALRKWQRFGGYWEQACRAPCEPCIEPLPQDKRFRGEAWQRWPFNVLYQGFLLQQQWWHAATTGVPGVSRHHEAMVNFGARQILDVFSPSNFLATNPELLEQTRREGGANLARGASNLLEDWRRRQAGEGPVGVEAYRVGRDVAVTPGKVVYRNRLIDAFAETPYRLCCTATPAPNDIQEITNHAAFLGIMPRRDVLATFFVHASDDARASGWRLKNHARPAFWRWLASWGMSLKRPSDLGYSDEGYELPPLSIEPVIVDADVKLSGRLFPDKLKGVTDRAAVRRQTLQARVEATAALIDQHRNEPWSAWRGLVDEGRELAKLIGDRAILVEGPMSPEEKAERL
ncbi:poly-beta-hydroxybutyrate polymerase N-terminal domain-containing protein, partial [uncultured Halomonas sp.]|uniref:poly-beta-hydroxybutyrate polymerase N-terminal domain-containing protein n=1 Tax=uncultured Halomonas sp. TaxID=173971 RepID=UPI00262A3784